MSEFMIAPSILSANFARLGEEVDAVLDAGADMIHFDVMDNHYVPNLTIGPMVCRALRKHGVTAPIDVHLMVKPVDDMIRMFIDAGASYITFHPEASEHIDRSLQLIKDGGCKAGLVFNPATPLHYCQHVMEKLDIILLMSVNPGFGGQQFIPNTLDKLRQARTLIDASRLPIRLEIDGGVTANNIKAIAQAGADTFVAGSAIFNANDYAATIDTMRQALANAKAQRGIEMQAPTARDIVDKADLLMFDLDGTLADSLPDLAAAITDMLHSYGMPGATVEQVSTWVGNGASILVERALRFATSAMENSPSDKTPVKPISIQAALACFLDAYSQRNGNHTQLYPGVIDLLNSRSRQRKAIVTNKPTDPTHRLLNKFDIIHHFSSIVCGDTFANQKPHPQQLLETIKQHHARNPVLIGDSVNDVLAARAAGIPVIAVSYGYNHGRPVAEENPDRVVDSLTELL